MIVVTISRHFGAGGHTLAEKICERFGYKLVDTLAVSEIAKQNKVCPKWLASMEKEATSTALSMISTALSRWLFYKTTGTPEDEVERRKYLDFLTRIFNDMADKEGDGYVIVGRGGQVILQDHPRALHLLLVADYESRVRFLQDHHSLTRSEAEREIRSNEKDRAALGSRLFDRDFDDLNLYHAVLNTGRLPYDMVLDAVFHLVEQYRARL